MRPAFDRVDVVREGVDGLVVARVPLHRDLDLDAVARALDEDHVLVDRRLGAVQVLDEALDAALVEELVRFLVALVEDADVHAAVQERQLAQPLRQDVEAVFGGLEDQVVGLERDAGAALVGHADFADRRLRVAAMVALRIDLSAALDLHLEPFREGVHHGHADAMQAAGNLVGTLVELAAGVELREDDLGGRDPFGRVRFDRDAAPVVLDRHAAVDVDRDPDVGAVAGEGLVDGVVDDLEHEVVQTPFGGVPDVHAGTLPNGLETLEDLDVFRAVFRGLGLTVTHGFGCRIENTKLYRWMAGGARFIGGACSVRAASA